MSATVRAASGPLSTRARRRKQDRRGHWPGNLRRYPAVHTAGRRNRPAADGRRRGDVPMFDRLSCLLAAGARRAAHHDRTAVSSSTARRRCSIFPRRPRPPQSGMETIMLVTGMFEADWRPADRSRLPDAPGRVHPVGNDGRRLFHGACAAEFLPGEQHGRRGHPVLLRLPLPGLCRTGSLERRQPAADEATVARRRLQPTKARSTTKLAGWLCEPSSKPRPSTSVLDVLQHVHRAADHDAVGLGIERRRCRGRA